MTSPTRSCSELEKYENIKNLLASYNDIYDYGDIVICDDNDITKALIKYKSDKECGKRAENVLNNIQRFCLVKSPNSYIARSPPFLGSPSLVIVESDSPPSYEEIMSPKGSPSLSGIQEAKKMFLTEPLQNIKQNVKDLKGTFKGLFGKKK